MFRAFRKTAILIIGSVLLILGVALVVLPGPAFIVIPLGLAILAVEFSWARRWLGSLRRRMSRVGRAKRFAAQSKYQ